MSINSESFEEIALPHLDAVYRAAVAISGQISHADDLVQDTFQKAFQRFESFEQGTNCKAWLLKILRNTWIDRLRHQKIVGHIISLEEEIIAHDPKDYETAWSNSQDLIENFSDEQIIKALSELPEDKRLTLYLIDVEQLSQNEVARITDVAVGTVKSRASRARMELKKKLSSYAIEMGFKGGEK